MAVGIIENPVPNRPHITMLVINRGQLVAKCNHCNKTSILSGITQDALTKWQGGGLIQNVFTHLNPGERELLVSGTCGPCFDQMFGEECLPEK